MESPTRQAVEQQNIHMSPGATLAYTNLLRGLAKRNIVLGTAFGTVANDRVRLPFPLVEVECMGATLPQEQTVRSIVEHDPRHIAWHITIDDIHTSKPFVTDEWKLFVNLLMAHDPTRHTLLLSYHRSIEYGSGTLDAIETFRDGVPEIRCLLESNHPSWKTAEVQRILKSLRLSHVFIDAPKLYGIVKDATYHVSSIGYLRVLGRNIRNWFEHAPSERYHYHYSHAELEELGNRVRKLKDAHDEILVTFCNHPPASAIQNAIDLAHLLI